MKDNIWWGLMVCFGYRLKQVNSGSANIVQTTLSSILAVIPLLFFAHAVTTTPANAQDTTSVESSTSKNASGSVSKSTNNKMTQLNSKDMRSVTGRQSLTIDTQTIDKTVEVDQGFINEKGGFVGSGAGLYIGEVDFHSVVIGQTVVDLRDPSLIEVDLPSVSGSVAANLYFQDPDNRSRAELGTLAGGGISSQVVDDGILRIDLPNE